MEQRPPGGEPTPEFRLSQESAREIAGQTGPPRRRRTFLSTDHLSTEAAAAYVDGRLPHAGQTRADAHLAQCEQCRREVDDQREARRALRGSGPIRMPSDLRDRLSSLGGLGETVDDTAPGSGAPGAGESEPRTPGERTPGNGPTGAAGPDVGGGRAEATPWSRLLRRFRGTDH
ncbi:hypothetical protein NCCP2495_04140 [Dietzia sp. NCCP-2495]|uniref:anti-sigma factor family protein n=1 Tax=Dietzia sp. NCCP-2495 TaxID=2934675 RepID=UPI0022304B07|nr:zf-HC2 domain-containing protein [Dietzia sp. NCCP-2495]GLB62536.1 hypothetical protein NCCP2495_04140 [Dietzia sp. NCCP-2495]